MTKTIYRLKQFIDYKKLSLNAFDEKIGAGNGYIGKQIKKNASIGSDVLEKIFSVFGDLNPFWLMKGEGDMLLPSESNRQNTTYTPASDTDIDIVSEHKKAIIVSPTKGENVSPTVSPTHNLGLPKVVTITENNDEVITLVNVKAAAGYLNGYADHEYIERLPTIRMPGLKGGTHRAFEIKGHSMSPTMHNGSIAVGRWVESLDDIRDRYIYIVITKTDGIVLKRVLNRVNDTGKLILISDNHNKREYPNILLDPEDVIELWKLRGGFIFEFPEPNELYNRFNDLEAKVTIMASQMQNMLK